MDTLSAELIELFFNFYNWKMLRSSIQTRIFFEHRNYHKYYFEINETGEINVSFNGNKSLCKKGYDKDIHKYGLTINNYGMNQDTLSEVYFDYLGRICKLNFHFLSSAEFNNLPNSIEKMSFTSNIICDKFPPYLKDLKINFFAGSTHTKPTNLPETLINLNLWGSFNLPLDFLPKKLKRLILWNVFNHPIDNLPSSLTHLSLGKAFNHPLNNLPKSIKFLELKNNLVEFKHLTIKYIKLGCSEIPTYSSITHAYYDGTIRSNLTTQYSIELITNWPSRLQSLVFLDTYDRPLINLPKTLKYLDVGSDFNQKINNLPQNLKKLTVGFYFNQPLDRLPNLTYLCIDSFRYTHSLDKLPISLKTLIALRKNLIEDDIKRLINLIFLKISYSREEDLNNNFKIIKSKDKNINSF